MVRFLRTVYRHTRPRHGLPAAVLLSRLRAGIVSVLRPERVAARIGAGIRNARSLGVSKSLGIAKALEGAKAFGVARPFGIAKSAGVAKARGIAQWILRRPEAEPSRAGLASSGSVPVPDAARAGTPQAKPPNTMQTFVDLIANAVNPSMSRDERERVYGVVRQAVLRLYEDRSPLTADPQAALQLHLVEETIRDLEAEIMRHNAMARMRLATEAQAAEIGLPPGKPG